MAGIAGIARDNQEQRITRALRRIAHRGAGMMTRSAPGATLGQVWSAAHETYAACSGRHHVVLDGEIYNWRDLVAGADCPLAAVEQAYDARGATCVADLDGPFALAIATPRGLFLARDAVGVSPLYYGRSGGALCFGSELKALAGWAQDLRDFPPGHYYEPGRGLRQFAAIEKRPAARTTRAEAKAKLRQRLEAAVRKRAAEGEVGVWLSGGLDSATMAALARPHVRVLHTFAVGVAGCPDLEHARAAADFIGAEHHERACTREEMLAVLPQVIYHLESFDALLVRSSVTNFMVGEMSSQWVPAVLSGEGGDELFAGYGYLKRLDADALPDELVDITRRLHNTALQRVDRCSAGHGLVARTGFLDRDVLEYALRIPVAMKVNGTVEKWVLRQAVSDVLPPQVVNRPKAKFWEGAGVGELLSDHAGQAITDAEFAAERAVSETVTLNTKEELLYYRIFQDHFDDGFDPALVGRTKGAPAA